MSILNLTNDTLLVTPAAGAIELADQFYASDANASRGQVERLILNTAQATTSGTNKDFTGIPAWAKRITVMFNGVSTSGTSNYLLQIGAGSITATGYLSSASSGATNSSSTVAFILTTNNTTAAGFNSGLIILSNVSGNTWAFSSNIASGAFCTSAGGSVTLAGVLDRIRIVTLNGTDTFDAGSVNILVEG